MTALGDFVIKERLVKFFQAGGKLAGVNWADAIILSGREDQWLGVIHIGPELVVRRNEGEERALLRHRDRTILAYPGCARRQMLEPQHVEQRDLDYHRSPHFRVLRELDAHQQAAIGASDNSKPARAGDLASDKILPHGVEVVVNPLPVSLEAGLMPRWTKLAAAPDVGQHIHAAMLEPQLADHGRIAGSIRNLESAIGCQQSGVRPVPLHVLAMHDKVWNLGPVL